MVEQSSLCSTMGPSTAFPASNPLPPHFLIFENPVKSGLTFFGFSSCNAMLTFGKLKVAQGGTSNAGPSYDESAESGEHL